MKPVDLTLVQGIEERLINAWPAPSTVLVEDWCLRFADGYSRRANSASAIRQGAAFTAPVEKAVRRLYGKAGLIECVRVTPLCAADTDQRLADAGFSLHDPSHQMIADIGPSIALDPCLEMLSKPSAEWIKGAAADYGGDKGDPEKLGAIVRLIRQNANFASLTIGGETVARGLSVLERGMVGLFDIVVSPAHRGKGHGRRLVEGLLRFARREGADRAYLQVHSDNATAISLYQSLGFRPLYTYTHRQRRSP
jgi:N-acetylglutamate synthase